MKLNKIFNTTIFLAIFLSLLDLLYTTSINRKTTKKPSKKSNSSLTPINPRTLNCSVAGLRIICERLFLKLEDKLNVKTIQSVTNGDQFLSFELPNLKISMNKLLPSGINWLTKSIGIVNISIRKPKILLVYGPKNLAARFSTKINLFGTNGNDLDIIGMKVKDSFTVMASLSGRFTIITNIINRILQSRKLPALKNNNPLTWFQNSNIAVLFSSGSVDFSALPAQFKPSYLNLLSIDKATGPHAAVQANLKFIDNKKNPITSFIKKYLFPNEVNISTLITNSYVEMFCGVTNINIKHHDIVLSKAGFTLKIDYNKPHLANIGIMAEMKIPVSMKGEKQKYIITLSGKILLSNVEAGFEMQMSNIWVNAFGFPRLSFGNVVLKVKVNIQSGIPSSFAFGGEIAIGLDCFNLAEGNKVVWKGQGHCIKAIGHIGINSFSPDENYYYGDLEPVSFSKIANALGASQKIQNKIKVPSFLENAIKFHKLTASFSLKDRKIGTIDIKKGFLIAGKVTSFSQTCEFHLSLNIQNKIKPTFSFSLDFMKPFFFGNAFMISAIDKKKGPLMSFQMGDKITDNGTLFSGEFDASVDILGVHTGVKIKLGGESFKFQVSGKIFNLLDASFMVESLYKLNMNKFKTSVAGEFKMTDELKNVFQRASNKAIDHLKTIKKNLKNMEEEQKRKVRQKSRFFGSFFDVFNFNKVTDFTKSWFEQQGSKIKNMGVGAAIKILEGVSDKLDAFQIKRITFKSDIDLESEKLLTQQKDILKLNASLEAIVFNKELKKDIQLSVGNIDAVVDSIFNVFLERINNIIGKI